MLVDIKESGLKLGQGPKGLSRDLLIERLGFPEIQTKGCAHFLIQETKQKVEAVGAEVLKTVLDNPRQINPALAESIAGVFDGDGSMLVNLFTHLSKDGKKLGKRHTFEIVPAITITAQIEEKGHLFKIINAVFGKKESLTIVNVNTGGKGIRLVIKNVKVLKEYVVPFFATYQPSIQKNRIRLKAFCTVLQKLPLDYQNKKRMMEIVREIYDTDLYERDKSFEHFLKIVELDYN
jgi:LAGLIDADG endonuclease